MTKEELIEQKNAVEKQIYTLRSKIFDLNDEIEKFDYEANKDFYDKRITKSGALFYTYVRPEYNEYGKLLGFLVEFKLYTNFYNERTIADYWGNTLPNDYHFKRKNGEWLNIRVQTNSERITPSILTGKNNMFWCSVGCFVPVYSTLFDGIIFPANHSAACYILEPLQKVRKALEEEINLEEFKLAYHSSIPKETDLEKLYSFSKYVTDPYPTTLS